MQHCGRTTKEAIKLQGVDQFVYILLNEKARRWWLLPSREAQRLTFTKVRRTPLFFRYAVLIAVGNPIPSSSDTVTPEGLALLGRLTTLLDNCEILVSQTCQVVSTRQSLESRTSFGRRLRSRDAFVPLTALSVTSMHDQASDNP